MAQDKIRNAAVFIAATKCWLARPEPPENGGPIYPMRSQHIDPCRFCDFGTDYLRMMILEAQAWFDYNKNAPVIDFERLPLADQRRLVAEAARIDDTGLATVQG